MNWSFHCNTAKKDGLPIMKQILLYRECSYTILYMCMRVAKQIIYVHDTYTVKELNSYNEGTDMPLCDNIILAKEKEVIIYPVVASFYIYSISCRYYN